MYGILMLLTLIAFIAIGDVIIVTSFEKDKHGKKHPWQLLWFISLIVVIFIFDKTGSFTNFDVLPRLKPRDSRLPHGKRAQFSSPTHR